ncbi:MAG TPA: lactonase family protein, partial [Chloroflexota bacterium]|nr:lactonase family protein [Chloroflexota bacterium]
MRVYVGTYTGPGKAEGIYVFEMDESSGALTPVQTVGGVDNPSFLALHPNGRTLYAVNESGDADGPGVSAFSVDAASGRLEKLNRQPSHGTSPCYVSLDPDGKCVLVANYGNGIVSVYPVQPDGRLGDASCVVQHQGSSTHRRQAGPHAHSIRLDPTGKYVLSCDLGCDRIFVYTLDTRAGKLTPNAIPYAQVSSGAGPRHIAFHPNGRLAFVNNEIDSTVTSFTWDAERGTLHVNDTRSTLPADYAGNNSTAQIAVHPGGSVVYVSNRGHDSIATFGVDPERGKLTPLGHQPTQGKTPRNFNLDPSGAFLYAANQSSNTIVPFRVDPASGHLTPTGHTTEVPAPVCVLFA